MVSDIRIERNYEGGDAPSVTVVVPCYNYAEYLPNAVKSVCDQSFRDLELIIVNDGSTDNTLEVARGLLAECRGALPATLIDRENSGHPSVPKNDGYAHARGAFWFTLDSDDMIKPDYVAKILDVFEEHPGIDVVYPGYQTFGATDWSHIPPDFDFDTLKYWDYIPYSSVFKRQVFEKAGGYGTGMALRIMEDWEFWLRAYGEGFRFRPLKEALLLHRTHGPSLFASTADKPYYAANVRLENRSLFDEFDMEWARRILADAGIEPFEGTKVLMIVDHFPPEVGGAERFIEELGLEFAKLGFLVDVATPKRGREFYYCNGLNLFEFDYGIGPYSPADLPVFEDLDEFVENGGYDLVLVKGGVRNWAIWALARPERHPTVFVPVINRETIEFLDGEEDTRRRLVERLMSAGSVISLTRTGHDCEFFSENGIPFTVIPNAVEFESPTVDFKMEMGIPDDTRLILCVGSYYEVKNQAWLVEALRQMPGNWVLAMMGTVLEEPYYHHVFNEARGDHRFLVLPPQEKGVVASAMEQADLLVLPSRAEAFGRVVLEAMSHRLPWVASSNCAGIKDLKGGTLVELERGGRRGILSRDRRGAAFRDPEPLSSPFVEEVRRLLSDEAERERLGEEGYREWFENYRWRNVIRDYLDVTGLEPDPARAIPFRRNGLEAVPALPHYVELLRGAEKARPLVSVILVTYNRPESFEAALSSVLEQTYGNFEVVVVNDGGLDVSDIVESFDDPRVRYMRNGGNRGPAGARNLGIRSAGGEYIAYLDDDDRYYPTHLETLVGALRSQDARFAYSDSFWRAAVKRGNRWSRRSKNVLYSEDFDRDALYADNYIPVICAMHTADLFDEAGYFDEELGCLEDWDLWIRMAMRCDFKHVRRITCEVCNRIEDETNRRARIESAKAVTRVINDKYDGLVFRSRDLVNLETRSLLQRFEVRRRHSLTDALDFLEWWLAEHVDSPELELVCARGCRELGEPERARHHLARCLAMDPGSKQAANELEQVDGELAGGKGRAPAPGGPNGKRAGEGPAETAGDERRRTPIIVSVEGSGKAAAAAVEQIPLVTKNYSLTVLNNGTGEASRRGGPGGGSSAGGVTARSINEAIGPLGDEYVAVLRGDVLLYEDGWLDNIISFMDRREDVGLVGLGGWHSITEQGVPDLTTSVFRLHGHPDSERPTWRYTEVAAIDDAGWVMRNNGVALSEAYNDESLFALDLSLSYIRAGFRVYVAAVEFAYSRDREIPDERYSLSKATGNDDLYGPREAARETLRGKWSDFLPLTRGFCDESYVLNRVEELANYARSLEKAVAEKDDALRHVSMHEAQLERALARRRTTRIREYMARRFGKRQ